MFSTLCYLMVYLGSALMVYNIVGFVRFAHYIKSLRSWKHGNDILYVPIALLVFFLLGYLAVGILGKPDLIVSGILFGGSIFVFIMYYLLSVITRRILESEQIEAKLMAAEESNRAKTSFLATVSHEMRTPMNMIIGLDELTLKSEKLEPEARDNLEKIGLSARHMLGLINNILDLNSIEAGELKIRHEPFSLKDSLDQVDLLARELCEKKGLIYHTSAPACVGGCHIGDPTQIKKVLLRLLDNAVKYTNMPGTVTLRTECLSNRDGVRTYRFSVRDTGVGIDSEFLPNIFDLFSQEDASSTNRYGGSGLSLAAAKGVVELMGGTITAESRKNEGSVFSVTLPLVFTEDETVAEAADEDSALAGKRILIAEDHAMNAEIVAALLEMRGIASEHAENGQAALEMFEKAEPGYYDAVLMDIRMPVMDGLEATRRIRALDRADAKTIPIVALTANAFESDVQQSLEAGVSAHLAKPTDADALYAALKKIICGEDQ
ncbi:MAG: response regulator [Ruminococcaceae bacterium]|nr:response regulator [Oscillospiraceae bacterium]